MLHPLRRRGHRPAPAPSSDVSFEVAPGEFFGIVGRNGSGKSTLLKCLAGIYRLDAGEIYIRGRLSTFIELGVGFNPDLAARDNIVHQRDHARPLAAPRRAGASTTVIEFAELERLRRPQAQELLVGHARAPRVLGDDPGRRRRAARSTRSSPSATPRSSRSASTSSTRCRTQRHDDPVRHPRHGRGQALLRPRDAARARRGRDDRRARGASATSTSRSNFGRGEHRRGAGEPTPSARRPRRRDRRRLVRGRRGPAHRARCCRASRAASAAVASASTSPSRPNVARADRERARPPACSPPRALTTPALGRCAGRRRGRLRGRLRPACWPAAGSTRRRGSSTRAAPTSWTAAAHGHRDRRRLDAGRARSSTSRTRSRSAPCRPGAEPDGVSATATTAPLLRPPIDGPSALGGDFRRFFLLARTLAVTDFKLRFFGSVLGYFWQLGRPLMLFGVLYVGVHRSSCGSAARCRTTPSCCWRTSCCSRSSPRRPAARSRRSSTARTSCARSTSRAWRSPSRWCITASFNLALNIGRRADLRARQRASSPRWTLARAAAADRRSWPCSSSASRCCSRRSTSASATSQPIWDVVAPGRSSTAPRSST